ncbi:MAG: 3-phosphoshikimate 1-carboxyvinyltransferase [Proteobacteria bacterium]|nr:3-phosphoshikimate 1-carboxyvinyltransferase [Pseudomonadota bacterium]MCP4915741.1 3-phosphoshikimate 1-carboxyvinyltransferase [Pseudomonadota bacterium]
MQLSTLPGRPLTGRIRVPGDKSVSHRALMFNGLARGTARVEGLLDALDVRATMRCMRQLGATIEPDGDAWLVTGCGGELSEPDDVLDCGNSGTSMRLLTGLIAGQEVFAVLNGDEHLRKRPMARVTRPLSTMGARFWTRMEGRAPIAVQGGALTATAYTSPIASAQVKSALILATLGAERGELVFREPHRSRDHSERMLRAMGVTIDERDGVLYVPAGQVPLARDVVVPGDISSAAFFLVAASIVPGSDLVVENVGLNPTRDGVLEVLGAMGADITVENPRDASGEPVADLHVRHVGLRGTTIGGAVIPRLIDEVPALAVAAAFAQGVTTITDAAELRVKETDRISAVVDGLASCGVDVAEQPDGMTIGGGHFAGGRIDARGDHRIAMSFLVAGCAAGGVTIPDASNVATSFPTFASLLEGARV